MSLKSGSALLVNRGLRPFGLRVVRVSETRPWDADFLQWIEQAKVAGVDPNDIGDRTWDDDPLEAALQKHYLPHVSSDSRILELGPGSGRLSRHIIHKCGELILVDYSSVVCGWIESYLQGKGKFQVHHIKKPILPMIEDCSVDAVMANGVFEHIDRDEMYWFLKEFKRVLKPRCPVLFNFNNLISPGGRAHFLRFLPQPGERNIFRFYHPESVAMLAESVGLHVIRIATDDTRFAFAELKTSGTV